MDDRRHAAARSSKPFKRGRDQKDSGETRYGKENYRSQADKSSGEEERPANRYDRIGRKGDKRFHSKKGFTPKGKAQESWQKERLPAIVSDMQITDGKHRGKYLKSTESPKIRPTARRIRESLFRILFRKVRAGRFLDLCAGSGTVGIEAISCGALIGTFVERSAKMCSFIKVNLESCEIKEGHGEIFEMEVVPFLKQMAKRRRFWDVVYFDPPYDSDYDMVLKYFERGVAIKPHGTLVIEHHSEMFFPENIGVMRRWKVVVQGETAISFYDRKS